MFIKILSLGTYLLPTYLTIDVNDSVNIDRCYIKNIVKFIILFC